MHFNDFPYQRPEIDSITSQLSALLEQFQQAQSAESQIQLFREIESLRMEFDSMHNLCMVRHTIDTRDAFYEKENAFFDSNLPLMEDITSQLYRAVLASPFRGDLETAFGKQFFVIAELTVKTFQPGILDDLKEENRLKSEYVKLMASAQLEFDGKKVNLSSITPYEMVEDRSVRKAAAETKWAFYDENEAQIDEIFDQLVKVRTRIARALGYDNFIELGYARMLRSDYNAEMAANFREQIRKHVVPVASKLKAQQAKRIGVETLYYYDEEFKFKSGNPKPQGEPDWIIEQAKTMYQELSGETHAFFSHMTENALLDLLAKDGKAPGGYCTYIGKYKAPFIFSNFNGTAGDIDVLTHEAGHAFQVYSS
ncbi:MAG: M3 family oligoendopeptidase, partial [Bacteroidota bacterium]